ncbi:MAG: amidohydrolase family protein, partial [Candidatus Thorarchaeota archaeon]
SGLPVIETNGTIFPGLIDSHNHLTYDTIPIWNVTSLYTNRYQWQQEPNVNPDIEYPVSILTRSSYSGLIAVTAKYAEVKALVGGTTAIQGSTMCDERFTSSLVRNIEHTNFGEDRILTYVPAVENWDENQILNAYHAGNLDAFFGHIGEGTDELSHEEFETLRDKGLLIEPLVAIHCVAFNRSNFADMASVGAKMVWSPTSNLLMYGDTADVQAAWEEGVCVALSPDWSPGGSKNLLGEIKIADQWNKDKLDGFFSDFNLVEMVTTNAAEICGWEDQIGKIKVGYHADLLVLDNWNETLSPYRTLINAIDFDVKLVTVEGNPLYGLTEYFDTLKPGDYETIEFEGWCRALDITSDNTPQGDQLFSWINSTLSEIMAFTPEVLYNFFNVGTMSQLQFTEWLDNEFPDGLHSIPIDPIYTYGDPSYFTALSSSANLNQDFSFDMSVYYNRLPN